MYQGWSNKATWAIYEAILRHPGTLQLITNTIKHNYERATQLSREYVRAIMAEENPDGVRGLSAELITYGLEQANWSELVRKLREDEVKS